MEKLEKIYSEIKRIDELDKCPISNAVCKFTEEYGELVREINKTTGRKTTDEDSQEVLNNIKEETADVLQNLLLICSRFNISLDELFEQTIKKNKKWESKVPERQEFDGSSFFVRN